METQFFLVMKKGNSVLKRGSETLVHLEEEETNVIMVAERMRIS